MKVFHWICLVVTAIALVFGPGPSVEAQSPIRIGVSLSQSGVYAALSQNQVGRGYPLCPKHTNEKGGVLGRRLELVLEDDQSQPATAARVYEKLLTQDKVDLVLGPYGSPMTDPVADVTEKHRIPLVAAGTTTTSFFMKGRKFKVRAANPDVLAAGTYLDHGVAITHLLKELKELNVNPKMYSATIGGALPRFYEALGRNAEFLYANSPWEPELVTLRAGGLIPVARQYPGAREFFEAHHREYPGADFSYQTAAGYAGCQVLVEAVKHAGSLDRERIRDAILKLDFNTVFGPFNVDPDGLQIAHKMLMLQWQDGKKIILWPEELATGKPCFPTPPWSGRK